VTYKQRFENQEAQNATDFEVKGTTRNYSFYLAEENSIYLKELFTLTIASV